MFVVISLVFLLAGIVKGVIGMGLPTVAVALLGMVMAPQQAAAILVVPSLVTNVMQLLAGPRLHHLLKRLLPMVFGIFAGTWGAAWLGLGQSATVANGILGIALVAYALLGLGNARLSVSSSAERALSFPVGALTGAITAATGVFVLPAVPFVQALGLEKDDLVQALGICFTVSTLALAAALGGTDSFPAATGILSMLAVVPAMGGMWLGQLLRSRISPALFRKWFFAGLLCIGMVFLSKFLRDVL